MKAKHALVITLVFVLLIGAFSVDAAALEAIAAAQPWTAQVFQLDMAGVQSLSTAFVGKYQVPIMSYTRPTGPNWIWYMHRATEAVAGNCGFEDTWTCFGWSDGDLIRGTVSNLATESDVETHLEAWAYLTTDGTIRGAAVEHMNDMSFVDTAMGNLIQISKFGSAIVGVPSLQMSGWRYRLAVTIRDDSTDIPPHKLVYLYFTGDSNTSCLDSGSAYQCDVIDTSFGGGSMGAPSLDLAGDGTVGIAYQKSGSLMYAYPHTETLLYPSNCGPGEDTWRCISIKTPTLNGVVGLVVGLAMGQDAAQRGIAFTYDDMITPVTLWHAGYVGSGGNCGTDRNFSGMLVEKWECEGIVNFHWLNPADSPSISIDLDPSGYPTIAYDYASGSLANKNLYVAYPDLRLGIEGGWWTRQKIDGATMENISTGAQAALALSKSGLGFVGYFQKMEMAGEVPDLKIAWQQFQAYLPVIRR